VRQTSFTPGVVLWLAICTAGTDRPSAGTKEFIMATTALATHSMWDCRWSRPRHGFVERAGQLRESHRACTREESPRQVLEEDCAVCPFWEPLLAGVVTATIPIRKGREDVGPPSTRVPASGEKVQNVGTRTVLVLMAVGMFAVGLTQLTSLLAVPLVVALWLGAAGLLGIAAFASLDGNPPPCAGSCEYENGSRSAPARRAGRRSR
jgi:hypothetical protein